MLPGVKSSKNSGSSNLSNGYNIDTDSDKYFDKKLGLLRKRTYVLRYLRN